MEGLYITPLVTLCIKNTHWISSTSHTDTGSLARSLSVCHVLCIYACMYVCQCMCTCVCQLNCQLL